MVAHQQVLLEQIVEIKRPIQTLQTADESGWVTDDHNHLTAQLLSKPGSGENRERVLQQWARRPQPAIEEATPIPDHTQHVLDRAQGFDL